MHSLGNVGMGGFLHALLASSATQLITNRAYSGFEPRAWMRDRFSLEEETVDFGCGVGMSTVPGGTGVDTSPEMVRVAKWRTKWDPVKPAFQVGNAETWGNASSFDAVTLCFVLHEMPRSARLRTLSNAMRVARRSVHVMDIHPSYTPSAPFLWGEPYALNYFAHVEEDVASASRWEGWVPERLEVIPGHVVCWSFFNPTLQEGGEEDGATSPPPLPSPAASPESPLPSRLP
jgi:SAM-dependent methyltransferase